MQAYDGLPSKNTCPSTTINLSTLALLVYGHKWGLYLGVFTSSTIGILQAPVHAFGFFQEGKKSKKLGAGFYSSIPLAFTGLALLIILLKEIWNYTLWTSSSLLFQRSFSYFYALCPWARSSLFLKDKQGIKSRRWTWSYSGGQGRLCMTKLRI